MDSRTPNLASFIEINYYTDDEIPEEIETEEDLNTTFSNLLYERGLFENRLYDILVDPFMYAPGIYVADGYVPDSFWDPVKVSYENVRSLKDIIIQDNCCICTDNHINFKKLHCCNQKMCNGCCYEWFDNSVKCPFCYQDLREFDLKKTN